MRIYSTIKNNSWLSTYTYVHIQHFLNNKNIIFLQSYGWILSSNDFKFCFIIYQPELFETINIIKSIDAELPCKFDKQEQRSERINEDKNKWTKQIKEMHKMYHVTALRSATNQIRGYDKAINA